MSHVEGFGAVAVVDGREPPATGVTGVDVGTGLAVVVTMSPADEFRTAVIVPFAA